MQRPHYGLIADKVVNSMDKIIQLLISSEEEGEDQRQKLERLQADIGRYGRIYQTWYKIRNVHLQYSSLALTSVVGMALKDRFTPEVRQAWESLCKFGQSLLNMGFQIDDASSRDVVKEFAVCDEQKALLKKSFLQL